VTCRVSHTRAQRVICARTCSLCCVSDKTGISLAGRTSLSASPQLQPQGGLKGLPVCIYLPDTYLPDTYRSVQALCG
jgi:hypothetical protein